MPAKFAMVVRPHGRIAVVLLTAVKREVERGAYLLCREDDAMFPEPLSENEQSNPRRVEDDGDSA